jgi:hypothetical protein
MKKLLTKNAVFNILLACYDIVLLFLYTHLAIPLPLIYLPRSVVFYTAVFYALWIGFLFSIFVLFGFKVLNNLKYNNNLSQKINLVSVIILTCYGVVLLSLYMNLGIPSILIYLLETVVFYIALWIGFLSSIFVLFGFRVLNDLNSNYHWSQKTYWKIRFGFLSIFLLIFITLTNFLIPKLH